MLIQNPVERKERAQAKRQALLRFLRDEIYTVPEVAGRVLGICERGTRSTVAKLEKEGLVIRHSIKLLPQLPPVVLIGITESGQAAAFDPHSGEQPVWKAFEPHKINLVYLTHTLELQRLRLQALSSGRVSRWLPGDRLGAGIKGIKRPDAVLLTSGGVRVAVEVERTLKNKKRYHSVLQNHLKAIQQNKWDRVIWACPNNDIMRRVQAAIESVHKSGKLPEVLAFCEYQDFLQHL